MKSSNRIISVFMISVIVIGIAVALKVAPTVTRGYNMYQEVLSQTTIEEVVQEIKNDENYITLSQIPDDYLNQAVKSEDKRFFYHFGIDFIATTRAMYNNIKEGSFVQGGSTITQQLAKNMFFSFEKKYERKIAELFMAFKLESMLTKDEILELYCNITYLGEGCYGLKEAAEYYYNVNPMELTKNQIATLVFSFKNPSKYNPKALMMTDV